MPVEEVTSGPETRLWTLRNKKAKAGPVQLRDGRGLVERLFLETKWHGWFDKAPSLGNEVGFR